METESWTSALNRAHDIRQNSDADQCMTAGNIILDAFGDNFLSWKDQIFQYVKYLSKPRDEDEPLSNYEKAVIRETRAALRFGLCCLSFRDDAQRTILQNTIALTFHWHTPLVSMLSHRGCDSKCRLFGARLISNLATSNAKAAAVLTSSIPISPSESIVSAHILNGLSNDSPPDQASLNERGTWVDMLIASSRERDRETLAAVSAALYNSVVALEGDSKGTFARQLASDSMLISTLLRQFVSVNFIKTMAAESNGSDVAGNDHVAKDWDSATEWIFLLLTLLMRLGLLQQMYHSISAAGSKSPVVPEQNVLLHCAVEEAQNYAMACAKHPETTHAFGGETGWEAVAESFGFLADIFAWYCQPQNEQFEIVDAQLAESASLSSLDILAICLGADNQSSTNLRNHLGRTGQLIHKSSQLLGATVDDLNLRSHGLKARDLKLSKEEQEWMTSLVRLQGNLCFRSRYNQDLMRTTLVPKSSTVTGPTANTEAYESAADPCRNALHVLLSCTSFATSCFTLREWGVIAIRNILEDNEANQEVVAALDAQSPIQSAALDQAGVRVKMSKNGQVSLSTLNENDAEAEC